MCVAVSETFVFFALLTLELYSELFRRFPMVSLEFSIDIILPAAL